MNHEESKIQRTCVQWFRYSFPRVVIASFPNGVYINGTQLQRVKRWNILKAEGATSGMPDLLIAMASGPYHGLFIEMKTSTGKLSDQQKIIHAALINSGYCVKICRSLDEFILVVQKYLEY
jgi:hypothetical protein